MASADDILATIKSLTPQQQPSGGTGTPADDILSIISGLKSGDQAQSAAPTTPPDVPGGGVANPPHRFTFLPLESTSDATGAKSYSLAVPGVVKGMYDTAIAGGEAARGMGSDDDAYRAATNAALMAVGTRFAAPAARTATDAAIDASKAISTPPIRTSAALRAASADSYKTVDESGVRISPESFQDFANSLPQKLDAFDSDIPELTPKAAAVVNRFQNYPTEEDAPLFAKLDKLRQTINKAASSTKDPHDALVLGDITDNFDDYMTQLGDKDLDAGEVTDLDAARGALYTARDLWKQQARARRIEDVRDIAENQTDPDLYIRQRFTSFTRKPNIMAQYSPDQQDLIGNIARQGTLGQLGRAAPHITGPGMVKALVYGEAADRLGMPGAIGAGVAAAGSTAAFHGAQMLRQSRINDLLGSITKDPNAPVSYMDRFRALRAQRAAGVLPDAGE